MEQVKEELEEEEGCRGTITFSDGFSLFLISIPISISPNLSYELCLSFS